MTRRLLSRLSIAGAFTLLAAVNATAGRIEGRLTLPDGHGIPGVTVTVAPAAVSAITGADGQFVLDGVADGEQAVVFTLADFVDTVTVVVAGITVRMDRTVDWTLRYTDLVTVTGALRRRERLVETPASASVVQADVIARDGGHGQLPKLLEAAPGVEVVQSGVFDFDLNMRGFNRALNRRVLVLIDGRDPGGVLLGAQEWAAYAVPLDDIAQVEVINGPGSALYGANAFNGVVSIVTKDPRFHQGGRLLATFGGRATAGVSGMYADVLGDTWSYRVSGSAMRTDDFYVDRTRTVEYPGLPLEAVSPHAGTAVAAGTVRMDRAVSNGGVWSIEGGSCTDLGQRVRLRLRPRAERRHLAPLGSDAVPARRMAGGGVCGREARKLDLALDRQRAVRPFAPAPWRGAPAVRRDTVAAATDRRRHRLVRSDRHRRPKR